MSSYKLSTAAKEDLIRIHHWGIQKFGVSQADKYFVSFFEQFEAIAQSPYSFEAIDYIKTGYRRCPCGSETIYYKIDDENVKIMAIVGRQELDKIL